jgi:hypothetical protein
MFCFFVSSTIFLAHSHNGAATEMGLCPESVCVRVSQHATKQVQSWGETTECHRRPTAARWLAQAACGHQPEFVPYTSQQRFKKRLNQMGPPLSCSRPLSSTRCRLAFQPPDPNVCARSQKHTSWCPTRRRHQNVAERQTRPRLSSNAAINLASMHLFGKHAKKDHQTQHAKADKN